MGDLKPGDIVSLGRHRLMCGDALKYGDMQRLLDGVKVDMLLTDPPYGVDYAGKNTFLNSLDEGNRLQMEIVNDAIADYRLFFRSFLKLVPFADYNTVYVFMLGKELHSLRLAFDDCGVTWGDYLVWLKNKHVLGRKNYLAQHAFIVYGWKGRHKFHGGHASTILEYAANMVNDLHPTQKPVKLLRRLIEDGSAMDAVVLDCFGGGGQP